MSDEEDDVPVPFDLATLLGSSRMEPTVVSGAIEAAHHWLTGDSSISDVEPELNTILSDHQTRLKVLMVAIARRRANDLLNLDEMTTRIERVLSDDKFLTYLIAQDPGALVKLYSALKSKQDRAVQFIWKILEGGFPNRLEDQDSHSARLRDRLVEKGINVEDLSPAKRERVRSLLEEIQKEVQSDN